MAEIIPLRKLSEFAWRTVELDARIATRFNRQVIDTMPDAIAGYRNNGFCFFQPYGDQEQALHQSITDAISQCSEIVMHPDNTAENYRVSKQLTDPVFLEQYNQFISFSKLDENALNCISQFLQFHNDLITAMLGYSYSVLNVRCQISKPGATVPPFGWHNDEFPASVVKILYYLDGASESAGSTAVRLQSGEEMVFEGEVGSWVLIDVNSITHKGIPSTQGSRKMLEITLGPAMVPDCTVYSMPLNASYPWVPWLSPSSRVRNNYLSALIDTHTAHFNSLVAELDGKATGSIAQDTTQYEKALEVLQYNADNAPTYLNIGGGPNFLHKGWRNFEEVFSVNNPVPFRLSANIPFPIQSDSLETVYTSHNLEHLDDETVAHILVESFRVLAPGGYLLIKIPDFDQYLDKWRKRDTSLTYENSPFSFKEARTWKNKGIADTITYRTAEMFCGVWNETFGDEKALFSDSGDWNGPGYVGAPWLPEHEIAQVFDSYTSCHAIAAYLKKRALELQETVYLNHQNAWSREEMQQLLQEFGYHIVSLDNQRIVKNGQFIPGINQWYSASAYYLAQKPD